MPAAQAKHSNPGPLKLVLPPNPCQRPIGTSASNSISSEIFASDSVFGQLISSTPSIEEIAHPRSRLVPNVPSLSLRSLKTGLVRARAACVIAVSCPFLVVAGSTTKIATNAKSLTAVARSAIVTHGHALFGPHSLLGDR